MRGGRRICVFCGSSIGARSEYEKAARDLGSVLAREGCTLVYGGGGIGLMGALADSMLDSGGSIVGVIPQALSTAELAHPRVREMRVVGSMHERKALMNELSQGFIALPGGFGTLDELIEIVTWSQLKIHSKPIGLLNVAGFFDPLMRAIDHAVQERFIAARHAGLLRIEEDAERLVQAVLGFHSEMTDQRGAPSS